jgi:biotin transport system substrate-specific component
MAMLTPSLTQPRVLADSVAGTRVRDAALVVGGAGLVGLAAQVAIPLWFTPVPLTLQTLAVLLVGASLGWQRALPALVLYASAGLVGVPWFSEGGSGYLGASFGYVIGFIVAAAVVGRLAAAGADRKPLSAFATMLVGGAVLYSIAVPWLAVSLDVSLAQALALGFVPFLLTDLIKTAAASALLPAAWKLVGRR